MLAVLIGVTGIVLQLVRMLRNRSSIGQSKLHDPADRRRFAKTVGELDARWIANEPPGVIELGLPPRPGRAPGGEIVLSLDREPLAWADPHDAWLQWVP